MTVYCSNPAYGCFCIGGWLHGIDISIWNIMSHLHKHMMHKICMILLAILIIPPASMKLKGGILVSHRPSVCPSVCGQNCVHSVTSTIPARSISYLHTILSNFRRCVACKGFATCQHFNFWQIFKFVTLTFSCFDLESDMNQWYGYSWGGGGILRT